MKDDLTDEKAIREVVVMAITVMMGQRSCYSQISLELASSYLASLVSSERMLLEAKRTTIVAVEADNRSIKTLVELNVPFGSRSIDFLRHHSLPTLIHRISFPTFPFLTVLIPAFFSSPQSATTTHPSTFLPYLTERMQPSFCHSLLVQTYQRRFLLVQLT